MRAQWLNMIADIFTVDDSRDTANTDFIANILSYFETGHLEHHLTQVKAMEEYCHSTASGTQTNDTQNEEEESTLSISFDLAAALRSVTSVQTWDFERMQFPIHKLLSVVGVYKVDSEGFIPSASQPPIKDGPTGSFGELPPAPFQSKYLHVSPLYQHYCLHEEKVNDFPHVNQDLEPQIVPTQYIPALQSSRTYLEDVVEVSASSPPRFLKDSLSPFWQDLDEVKNSGLLNTLTPKEVYYQEALFEVIGSEASYLRSLGVAVNHFYASKALRQSVSQMDHHILFSNLCRVAEASEKFLMDLEYRLGESVVMSEIGDIVLQHCPRFRALYVPYLTNMMYQEALVNQLLQGNRRFVCALKTLENEPVSQRQGLKSFLVLPFQRLTRLRLLMENILRLTEPNMDVYLNLQKAREALHKIIMECNDSVQKMKQIEELVCLEMLLDFSNVKLIPLIVSGRFLKRKGPLRKLILEGANSRISFVDIYLHLFNNLLVMSLQKEQHLVVLDYAFFPTNVRVEQLKTDILGLPADSFLLHLSQNNAGQPTALVLTARTRSDKESWMKVLSAHR